MEQSGEHIGTSYISTYQLYVLLPSESTSRISNTFRVFTMIYMCYGELLTSDSRSFLNIAFSIRVTRLWQFWMQSAIPMSKDLPICRTMTHVGHTSIKCTNTYVCRSVASTSSFESIETVDQLLLQFQCQSAEKCATAVLLYVIRQHESDALWSDVDNSLWRNDLFYVQWLKYELIQITGASISTRRRKGQVNFKKG